MRKLFLIITIFLIHCNFFYSQIKFYSGIKGGLASSYQTEIYFEDPYSTQSRLGIDAGMFLESSFGKHISVLAEIDYVEKGWKENGSSYLVKCLTLPLIVHLKIELGKFTPYVLAGPRLDIILGHDSLIGFGSMNSIDFGFTAGLGCENVIYKNYSMLAELKYDNDLNHNVVNLGAVGVTYYYSRTLEFLIGVKF